MLIPLIVSCAFFMENFDGTVITTALPAIASSFGEDAVTTSRGITAYLISLAMFIPISGWTADRFGIRTVFRLAIAVFTLASLLCGVCTSLPEFIVARSLQGMGGAMLVPVGRLAVLRSTKKSEFVQAMSFVTTPALLGGVLGPALGGFLTTYVSWRSIFLVNVPIGLLGIVLVSIFFEDHREQRPQPFDWRGFCLVGVSVATIMVALELMTQGAESRLFSASILGLGVVFALLAQAHVRRHAHPVIDLSLLKIMTFAKSVGAGSLFNIAAAGVTFLLPILMQVGFGMTAFKSGMLTLTWALGALVMKATAPRILRRFGFRAVLAANGIITAAAGIACSLFVDGTPALIIAVVLLIFGVSRSLQFTALNAIAYANVPNERMSSATSFASMCRQLCNAGGVAGAAIILQISVATRAAELGVPDIRIALVTISAAALVSGLLFLGLDRAAGGEVSGFDSEQKTPVRLKADKTGDVHMGNAGDLSGCVSHSARAKHATDQTIRFQAGKWCDRERISRDVRAGVGAG
jgi:EmrB/QacA subfamily drug resistance transporter